MRLVQATESDKEKLVSCKTEISYWSLFERLILIGSLKYLMKTEFQVVRFLASSKKGLVWVKGASRDLARENLNAFVTYFNAEIVFAQRIQNLKNFLLRTLKISYFQPNTTAKTSLTPTRFYIVSVINSYKLNFSNFLTLWSK